MLNEKLTNLMDEFAAAVNGDTQFGLLEKMNDAVTEEDQQEMIEKIQKLEEPLVEADGKFVNALMKAQSAQTDEEAAAAFDELEKVSQEFEKLEIEFQRGYQKTVCEKFCEVAARINVADDMASLVPVDLTDENTVADLEAEGMPNTAKIVQAARTKKDGPAA